jgi:hypothetical protein
MLMYMDLELDSLDRNNDLPRLVCGSKQHRLLGNHVTSLLKRKDAIVGANKVFTKYGVIVERNSAQVTYGTDHEGEPIYTPMPVWAFSQAVQAQMVHITFTEV